MATYQSKSWADIIAQYPTRYKIRHADLSEEQVDILNDFGTIIQSGDVFDAATFDNLEARIDAGFDTCDNTLAGTTVPTSSEGKNGDIYFQTSLDEEQNPIVTGFFVKIAGSWLEVSVGGASLPQAEGGAF